MATFTKIPLSFSTNGRGIKIVATGSLGTNVHSTGTSTTIIDEVWLYGANANTTAHLVTLEFGANTVPDDTIKVSITAQAGLQLLIPGLILTGINSTAARTMTAYANSANIVELFGYVNRITP